MDTFAIKFRAGSLDLNTIVTEYDHHRKFKVEMVTDESEPILLARSVKGEWTVILMEFAAQQRAELVITVPKAYGFFENLFHRSVTEELAYHTHLPLLLFKEDN